MTLCTVNPMLSLYGGFPGLRVGGFSFNGSSIFFCLLDVITNGYEFFVRGSNASRNADI